MLLRLYAQNTVKYIYQLVLLSVDDLATTGFLYSRSKLVKTHLKHESLHLLFSLLYKSTFDGAVLSYESELILRESVLHVGSVFVSLLVTKCKYACVPL